MKCNVGKTEKIVRGIIGLILLIAGYMYSYWFGVVGVVLLLTAAVGWCPLTFAFGINTCKAKK